MVENAGIARKSAEIRSKVNQLLSQKQNVSNPTGTQTVPMTSGSTTPPIDYLEKINKEEELSPEELKKMKEEETKQKLVVMMKKMEADTKSQVRSSFEAARKNFPDPRTEAGRIMLPVTSLFSDKIQKLMSSANGSIASIMNGINDKASIDNLEAKYDEIDGKLQAISTIAEAKGSVLSEIGKAVPKITYSVLEYKKKGGNVDDLNLVETFSELIDGIDNEVAIDCGSAPSAQESVSQETSQNSPQRLGTPANGENKMTPFSSMLNQNASTSPFINATNTSPTDVPNSEIGVNQDMSKIAAQVLIKSPMDNAIQSAAQKIEPKELTKEDLIKDIKDQLKAGPVLDRIQKNIDNTNEEIAQLQEEKQKHISDLKSKIEQSPQKPEYVQAGITNPKDVTDDKLLSADKNVASQVEEIDKKIETKNVKLQVLNDLINTFSTLAN